MARPIKDGLDYFPKDTGFYHDPKIRALIGRFGSDGAVLYDYILCDAYGRNGYYAEFDSLSVDIIAADLGISPEKIGLILDYLLNKSMLLDSTLFKAVKVLTSHGIQTRYQEAVRGRAKKKSIDVNGELWLLDEAETEGFIQVRHHGGFSRKNQGKSGKNCGFSREESLKERKGKEIKEKERMCAPKGAGFVPPTLEEVEAYRKERGSRVDPQGFIDFYAANGWMVGRNKMKDWRAAFRNAEGWERWDKKPGGPVSDTSRQDAARRDMAQMREYIKELKEKGDA